VALRSRSQHLARDWVRAAVATGALAATLVGVLAGVAPAAPLPSGCNNTTGVLGATISWYPANPGGMSALKVACVFDNRPGSSQVSTAFSVHDHNRAQYHNGAGRIVTTFGDAPAGATTIKLLAVSNGVAGLPVGPAPFNRVVTGPGIGVRTFIRSMTAGGTATLNRPTTGPVPHGSTLLIENGSGRSVTDATYGAPDLLGSASANFTSADVGMSVSGTGIPAHATIATVISPTQVSLSVAYGSLGGPTVTIGETELTTTARQVTGATTVSSVRINSAAAGWAASDIGLRVRGVCLNGAAPDFPLPSTLYVLATPSGANADTTGGLLAGQTECNLTIGEPSATAPQSGDVVGHQAAQLDLSPDLVGGVGDCAGEQPEGFTTLARWYNPGDFQGIGLTNEQPAVTKAIGQIFFDTSVADYSAFVVERKVATPGDPIGVVHYDLVYPFTPLSLVMCPGTATSPGLGFSLLVLSATAGQATLPPGTGRPGTAQVRSTLPSSSGGYTSTAVVRSDDPAVSFSPASAFQRLCAYPAGEPNAIDFFCGNG
jgi:hypothetical protein